MSYEVPVLKPVLQPVFFNLRSGRWSSFSWSSLYERTTDSSLSWADDELEKETTDKVKALFQSIDYSLYQDGEENEEDRPDTSDSFRSFQPSLSEELKEECATWREKFPHLRLMSDFLKAVEGLGTL